MRRFFVAVNLKSHDNCLIKKPLGDSKGFCDLFLNENPFLCIGKGFDPIAKYVPLRQLVISSCVVHIYKVFIVHSTGACLVIRGGKKLDKIVPVSSFLCFHKLKACFLKHVYNVVKASKSFFAHSVAGEIFA